MGGNWLRTRARRLSSEIWRGACYPGTTSLTLAGFGSVNLVSFSLIDDAVKNVFVDVPHSILFAFFSLAESKKNHD